MWMQMNTLELANATELTFCSSMTTGTKTVLSTIWHQIIVKIIISVCNVFYLIIVQNSTKIFSMLKNIFLRFCLKTTKMTNAENLLHFRVFFLFYEELFGRIYFDERPNKTSSHCTSKSNANQRNIKLIMKALAHDNYYWLHINYESKNIRLATII